MRFYNSNRLQSASGTLSCLYQLLDKQSLPKDDLFKAFYDLQFTKASPEYSEHLLTHTISLLHSGEVKRLACGWRFIIDVCTDVLQWTSAKHRSMIKAKIYKVCTA